VRLLAFSDLHGDLAGAKGLAEISDDADVVVIAGDLATFHGGLEEMVHALSEIETPTVLVPGNHETEDALRTACKGWAAATVLHGEQTEIDGVPFFGLGGGVPPTPFHWSFDLEDEEAAKRLAGCPDDAVLVVHSPPHGHLDDMDGRHVGSESILRAIEQKSPRVALCGHIHECAGQEVEIAGVRVLNLGPEGTLVDV
jgi:uncharacterized protein